MTRSQCATTEHKKAPETGAVAAADHNAWVLAWLLALSAVVPDQQVRYLMQINGAPVGLVEMHKTDRTFSYQSRHFYRSKQAQHSADFQIDAQGRAKTGEYPESLWLWQKPALNCVPGFDEITGKRAPLCAEKEKNGRLVGTALGEHFEATYDENGVLSSMVIGGASFSRWDGRKVEPSVDLFSNGFPLSGKGRSLKLIPPISGTLRPSKNPRPSGSQAISSSESCLDRAQALVKASPTKYEVVVGLVMDEGKAWPHAWVVDKKTGEHLDPSIEPGQRGFPCYLAFPKNVAGRVFIDLLLGKRRVARSGS